MNLIAHRRNTIEELVDTDARYGVEVDIRSFGERLVINHEPFLNGESFEEWLKFYRHRTLILNVKEEGLEPRLIELMALAGISDYFFLDQSFPFLIKYAQLSGHRCAVRVSEYESIDTALSLRGKAEWVWVDCFSRFPLSFDDVKHLKGAGFKICAVSPELQGRSPDLEIPELVELLQRQNISLDAVCTKRPDLWEKAK